MFKKLTQIGLTKNQASIYLALVKSPEQSAGEIAKQTKIDRSFVYGILEGLLEKGLVGYIVKENSRHYFATDPQHLMKNIEEKKEIVTEVIGEITSLCPERGVKRSVKVYEGKSGLKVMARAVLDAKEFCVLGGGAGFLTHEKLQYEFSHYLKEIKKNKIKARILINSKKTPNLFDNYRIKIKRLKKTQTKASFVLFGNKIAIYSLQERPIVIMIEDNNITNALQVYFDLLWEIAY